MKNALFLSLGLLFAVNFAQAGLTDNGDVVQDKTALACQGEAGRLELVVNQSANTISFSNVQALGGAQILKDVPMGMTYAATKAGAEIHFEYNWYYTAQYDLTFDQGVGALKAGDKVNLSLSGDDDDGAFFNDVKFICEAR